MRGSFIFSVIDFFLLLSADPFSSFPFLSLRSVSPFAGPKEGRGGLKGKRRRRRRRQRHGRIGSRGNGGKKKKEGTPLHVSGPISDDGKRKREREGQVHSLPGKVV